MDDVYAVQWVILPAKHNHRKTRADADADADEVKDRPTFES